MTLKISELLKVSLELWNIQVRIHATQRMFQRKISHGDLLAVLTTGTVIEQYPEDAPFPSLLVCGLTESKRPLHVVIALNMDDKTLFVITTYEPDQLQWTDNFSRRLK